MDVPASLEGKRVYFITKYRNMELSADASLKYQLIDLAVISQDKESVGAIVGRPDLIILGKINERLDI